MHIQEVPAGSYNPHPWEISRAHESMAILHKHFRPLRKHGQGLCIADIGAGDMYFAKEYLKNNPKTLFMRLTSIIQTSLRRMSAFGWQRGWRTFRMSYSTRL
jgi:hypothetical protein